MRRFAMVAGAVVLLGIVGAGPSNAGGGRLLLVPQQYSSISAAVAAAHPHDFILVGPGTYHEAVTVKTPTSRSAAPAATGWSSTGSTSAPTVCTSTG